MQRARSSTARLVAAALAISTANLAAQNGARHDPNASRLVTTDIVSFWRAYDRATLAEAAEIFQREYIDIGTPGLRDFVLGRIQSGRQLAGTVASRPRYYAAIRANTLAVDTASAIKDSIRASFRRLASIYPEAVFPDVYFVVGRLNSAGTTSIAGMLIGVEMNARDAATPTDELNDWERAVTGSVTDLPYLVAHELVHIQSRPDTGTVTLLERALREGGADFIGELISGSHTNRVQRAYGDAHERELWTEFQAAMHGTDISRWLFQGDRSRDRPADLGYYIGYRICRAFYENADDKYDAVRRIILLENPDEVLAESGYNP
jgi:hypothetical protein